MNGFHVPGKEERDAVMPWLLRERRGNILFPLGCVIAVFVGTVVFAVFGIINNIKGPLMSLFLIGIILIPCFIIVIKNTLTENEKVRMLRDGNVLITDARVADRGVKRLAKYSYVSYVEASYIDEGRQWRQTFVVSKRISRKVTIGSKGYIIKYNSVKNKWLDNKLVFLPK